MATEQSSAEPSHWGQGAAAHWEMPGSPTVPASLCHPVHPRPPITTPTRRPGPGCFMIGCMDTATTPPPICLQLWARDWDLGWWSLADLRGGRALRMEGMRVAFCQTLLLVFFFPASSLTLSVISPSLSPIILPHSALERPADRLGLLVRE